jgi:hypothetical protein
MSYHAKATTSSEFSPVLHANLPDMVAKSRICPITLKNDVGDHEVLITLSVKAAVPHFR